MELRNGRVVDGMPVISADFDLVSRASTISDFDGFTARDVYPHADPAFATQLMPEDKFDFVPPDLEDSGSEYEVSESGSDDNWSPPVRKHKGTANRAAAGPRETAGPRRIASRDNAPAHAPPSAATFAPVVPVQLPKYRPFVELQVLSATTRAEYTPLHATTASHVQRTKSTRSRNGQDMLLGDGRRILMAPERVVHYTQRRKLGKKCASAPAEVIFQEDRPRKLARAGDLEPTANAKKSRSRKKKGVKAAQPVQPAANSKDPKPKTPAQVERARRHRAKQRANSAAKPARAAKVLQRAVHIEANINVKAHVTGKSVFTAPSKYRESQLGSSSSSSPKKPVLHPDVAPMVRQLVDGGALYVPSNDNGILLTDKFGRLFGAMATVSKAEGLRESQEKTGDLLVQLREELDIQHQENVASTNSRGAFAKCQVGTSFGGGQTKPTPFSTDIGRDGARHPTQREARNRRLLAAFFKNEHVRRVIKHMQSCADDLFPEVMAAYRQLNEDLDLNSAFRLDGDDMDDFNYYFAATTFNLGPQVATVFHRDAMNLQQGICVIMAFGDYDARTSGHFIMKEPNLVLEFRPGDILFVMSALITHGNAPLRPGESRSSWTFYTAGGLFRWRAAGERCLNTLVTDREKREYLKVAKSWNELAWANLLTVDELRAYYNVHT